VTDRQIDRQTGKLTYNDIYSGCTKQGLRYVSFKTVQDKTWLLQTINEKFCVVYKIAPLGLPMKLRLTFNVISAILLLKWRRVVV